MNILNPANKTLPLIAMIGLLCTAPVASAATDRQAVLETYADIAHATYRDAWQTAQELRTAVLSLLEQPTEKTHQQAKEAWLEARQWYQQSEAYRFGNAIVDEWEGRVNAWPLDEGLIDYVDASYGQMHEDNPYYVANLIANTMPSGDDHPITPDTLRALHEVDAIEANVTLGYHPIEFLLWGQDLHGTDAGAGERPWTDYLPQDCTGGHCERRRSYLHVVTEVLIEDLQEMVGHWAAGGAARMAVLSATPEEGLSMMLAGLGSLSYGELAGERMQLGLLLHDPEEEHDCFSDNTHNSHYYDMVGIHNVYTGHYRPLDGSPIEGPALADLVKAQNPQLNQRLLDQMQASLSALRLIKDSADQGKMAYDQMIGADSPEGNAQVQEAIDALREQAKSLGDVAGVLGLDIGFEGSDSLDNPGAVFN